MPYLGQADWRAGRALCLTDLKANVSVYPVSLLFYSPPTCLRHEMQPSHPESPKRLDAIRDRIASIDWQGRLLVRDAPALAMERLYDIHPEHYVNLILGLSPGEGLVALDGDTSINKHSLTAALDAAGAGCEAVEQVLRRQGDRAFCSVRPPGHHAESTQAMGFCLFNSVALAAQRALDLGADRVAIIDFDVHHGNGTVEIFQDRPEVLVCSSFQYPFYPGRHDRVNRENIILNPLSAGTGGDEFRRTVESSWQKAVARHRPDVILVSAGFDAHRDDPLGGLDLLETDFQWVSELIVDMAEQHCGGRVVSLLEGGYNLPALSNSVAAHLLALAAL
jgi:acetoin utilization deacetylase AcuC-like enzyme